MNIDITKKYQTRDGREVVIFEVSDKVYGKIKCNGEWAPMSRPLSGMVSSRTDYDAAGDLLPVKTWRAWKAGEVPRFFMARNKESQANVIQFSGNYPNLDRLFTDYMWLHEDGTTTSCGVEE